ncbi:PEPxxWA-CTERM sorting domain-containing protein [Sandarakinorhabdus sp. AAP62]|uniref:PEPxxWA-CTERM sorting domain-containing protein n=1 Tax=Sandarakinorhabdus sp. AAP62 TaxID=1248916 RepID=UPI00031AEB51|nr:PEPxxWA-CTERM sorting domain-containing protein [Sandarakinorhabdus sp. AAP62]
MVDYAGTNRRANHIRNHLLALSLLASSLAAPAMAAQTLSNQFVIVSSLGDGLYSFVQSGFDGGANVSGSFTGNDLNEDFQLNAFSGEISNFTASFSGNALVAAWTSTNGVLVFDLNGSDLLGDGQTGGIEGIAVNFGGAPGDPSWVAGPGPFALCGTGNDCGRVQGPAPSAIPEPASWAMLIAGFGLAGAVQRRRRAAAA